MGDRRTHRGPHPEDGRLFSLAMSSVLRQATGDLSWLFTRGYSIDAAVKLVGDRYQLKSRQRLAVARCAAGDDAIAARKSRELSAGELAHRDLTIDGYNLLTTVEAALAGGVIIVGRDGCYRDMASMHSTYRKVEETMPAIELIGDGLSDLSVSAVTWLLDKPVSNSGRLAAVLRENAVAHTWNWQVELVPNPDAMMISAPEETIAVSADSVILDAGREWFNLAKHIVDALANDVWLCDLSGMP